MTSPRSIVGVPRLEELIADPQRAVDLTSEVARLLLPRCAEKQAQLAALHDFLLIAACVRVATPPLAVGPNLDPQEAAAYLRIKKSTLDGLRRTGGIPAVKIGKAYTYRREDLDRLRERLAAGGNSP